MKKSITMLTLAVMACFWLIGCGATKSIAIESFGFNTTQDEIEKTYGKAKDSKAADGYVACSYENVKCNGVDGTLVVSYEEATGLAKAIAWESKNVADTDKVLSDFKAYYKKAYGQYSAEDDQSLTIIASNEMLMVYGDNNGVAVTRALVEGLQ